MALESGTATGDWVAGTSPSLPTPADVALRQLSSRSRLVYSLPQEDRSMPSTARKLEQHVTVLERELRKVRSELKAVRMASQQPWWTRLAGKFKNDALFDEIIEVGNTYRRSRTSLAR